MWGLKVRVLPGQHRRRTPRPALPDLREGRAEPPNPAEPAMALTNDLPISLFAGRSNPALARPTTEDYGQPLGDVTIKDFSDGVNCVRYEEAIRSTDT